MKQFITAVVEAETEEDGTPVEDQFVEFEMAQKTPEGELINRRVLRAYQPHEGQLTFMLAATGRGQTKEQRFAAIINIMLSALRDDDQDYLEGRLLERDPKKRIKIEEIEEIFEYLVGEWFARPTQPPSDSAGS